MLQLIPVGGAGQSTDRDFSPAMPLGAGACEWLFSLIKPWAGGAVFSRIAGSVPPNRRVSAGRAYSGEDIKADVDTAPGAIAGGCGFLVDGFGAPCRSYLDQNPGKAVIAYVGPVPASDIVVTADKLYGRYIKPYHDAGAHVCLDTLMGTSPGSQNHALADYCKNVMRKPLLGESAERLCQTFMLNLVQGVVCSAGPGRMSLLYADEGQWMTAKRIRAAGATPIATIVVDDKAVRLWEARWCKALGWEVAMYCHDLTEAECAGL